MIERRMYRLAVRREKRRERSEARSLRRTDSQPAGRSDLPGQKNIQSGERMMSYKIHSPVPSTVDLFDSSRSLL
jgi:hypothetical protein